MDTPQQFLKDVVDGDELYARGMDYDTFIGNFRVTEFVGMSRDTARFLMKPIVEQIFTNIHRNSDKYFPQVKEVIDNPPPCIQENEVYQAIQYFAKSEGPFAVNLIRNTMLNDTTTIPEGIEDYMRFLSNIPKCKD
jgi:hypothetical protein